MEQLTPQKAEGTFTQVPNVFLDTCDLPETAQLLFLRLFREFGYRGGVFTGSIRKLSTLVRLSKSTVDRGLKTLNTSHLITTNYTNSDEEVKSVMTVTLNLVDLWKLNKAYNAGYAVPNWDKVMPECSNLILDCPNVGQDVPQMGHGDINLGHRVPDVSTKENTISSNTVNKNNKEEESASLSSPALSVWNIWCEAQGYAVKRDWTKTEQSHCETLAKMDIDLTPKLMNDAREYAQERQSFLKNKWGLKNLINALPEYLKDVQEETRQPIIPEMPELTEEEASELVLWTEHPDGVYALRGTIEQMAEAGIIKWMLRGRARMNGYDMPGMFHFDDREIVEYDRWLSERMAVAV